LNINSFIENRELLSNLKIDKIYHNSKHSIISNTEWQILENENYHKLYNKIRIKKENDNHHHSKHPITEVAKIKSNYLKQIADPNDIDSMNNYNFLDDDNKTLLTNQSHVRKSFDKLAEKNQILFTWTAMVNKFGDYLHGTRIWGVTLYEVKTKISSINKTFLKTIFKNSTEIKIEQHNIGEETLVIIELNYNKKGFNEVSDISWYEIFISDEENDFNWIGLKRYKVANSQASTSTDSNTLNLFFSFLTNKKGMIEVNKINLTIHPKGQNEKPINISGVPISLIITVI
jgi:hypothetical protein